MHIVKSQIALHSCIKTAQPQEFWEKKKKNQFSFPATVYSLTMENVWHNSQTAPRSAYRNLKEKMLEINLLTNS